MPSTFRSPRSLGSWLELDYFRRRTLFRGWWGGSLLVALVAALAAFGVMLQASGRATFQAGPLSTPHAMFQDRCEVCHTDFGKTFTRLWRGDKVASVPDDACISCHQGSHHNPPHAEMGTCVSCHREHRGHAALVRIPDSTCVTCHDDLRRKDGSSSPFEGHVVSFDDRGGHPPFRLWSGAKEKDAGTLKFNHAVHLVEKGVLVQRNPEQYQKLECANCHEIDGAGRNMKAISYDTHCKKCHPLSVRLDGKWSDPALTGAVNAFAALPLRHPGKTESPAEVRSALRDRLTRLIQTDIGPQLLDLGRRKAMPRFPYPPDSAPIAERQFAWVGNQLAESERLLFDGPGGCKHCHTVEQPAASRADRLPVLSPSMIRDRWWDHAKFKHDTHRMLSCEECHEAKHSKATSDILLPGIDLCLRCHNAKASHATARSDCVECHVYHAKSQKEAREKGTWRLEDVLRK